MADLIQIPAQSHPGRSEAALYASVVPLMRPLVGTLALLGFAMLAVYASKMEPGVVLGLGKAALGMALANGLIAVAFSVAAMRSGWRSPQGVDGVEWADAVRMKAIQASSDVKLAMFVLVMSLLCFMSV